MPTQPTVPAGDNEADDRWWNIMMRGRAPRPPSNQSFPSSFNMSSSYYKSTSDDHKKRENEKKNN